MISLEAALLSSYTVNVGSDQSVFILCITCVYQINQHKDSAIVVPIHISYPKKLMFIYSHFEGKVSFGLVSYIFFLTLIQS